MTDQTNGSNAQSPLSPPPPTPTEIELVRHAARIAAERDYEQFILSGKIPFSSAREKKAR